MCDQIEAVRVEFNVAWNKFEFNNEPLLRMERQEPDHYKLAKATAQVFYTMGRGDQATVDAAKMLLIGSAVDDLAVLDGGEV